MLTLVIGGARSGKSHFAQSLCNNEARVAYIATARLEDDEMRARIARHRRDRPKAWLTIEEPLTIANAVKARTASFDFILLDCLTIWLSNFSWEHRQSTAEELEQGIAMELDKLIIASSRSHIIVVANEVGCGIVPESPVGRQFRDLQGLANQQIAHAADFVYQTVAGIPMQIKPNSHQHLIGELKI